MSLEAIAWLDNAMDTYFRDHIYSLLNQAETRTHQAILKQWEELLPEMYGNHPDSKNELFRAALHDEKVNQAGKIGLSIT